MGCCCRLSVPDPISISIVANIFYLGRLKCDADVFQVLVGIEYCAFMWSTKNSPRFLQLSRILYFLCNI
jgi:hypothetical protein